jgi:transcriptional regulator with XRE-family HTH domain
MSRNLAGLFTSMKNRIKQVRNALGISQRKLEEVTGIDRDVWRNIEYGKQRVNEDHLAALEKIAPQYIYWIVTGKTLPICGQISPEIEESSEELLRNGADG